MKRRIGLLACVALCALCAGVFAQDLGETVEQPLLVAPKVLSVEGASKVQIAPTRWPNFYEWAASNKKNGEFVNARYSNKRRALTGQGDDARAGYFGIYNDFDAAGNQIYTYVPQASDYVSLGGLSLNINLANEGFGDYRTSTTVLVSYSVRIEGYQELEDLQRGHAPWFCSGWSGVARQEFPKGEVYMQLFVNDQPFGDPSIMTVPSAGQGQTSGAVDPTQVGQAAFTPEDFGGELPATLALQVKIYNDTSMRIESPAGQRNLIATITPKE